MENGIDVNLDDLVVYLPFEKAVKEFFESILLPEGSKYKLKLFLENQDEIYFEYFEENAKFLEECVSNDISKIASLVAPFLFKKKVDAEMSEDFNPIKMAGVSMACEKIDGGPTVCKISKEGNEDPEDIEDDIENDIENDDIDNKEDLEKEIEKIAAEDSLGLEGENADSSDDEIIDEIKDELEASAIDNVAKDDLEKAEDEIFDDEDKDHDGIPDKDEDHGELPDDFKGDHEDAEKFKEEKEDKKKGSKEDLKESTVVEDTQKEYDENKKKSKGVIRAKREKEANEILYDSKNEEIVPDESSEFTKKDLK